MKTTYVYSSANTPRSQNIVIISSVSQINPEFLCEQDIVGIVQKSLPNRLSTKTAFSLLCKLFAGLEIKNERNGRKNSNTVEMSYPTLFEGINKKQIYLVFLYFANIKPATKIRMIVALMLHSDVQQAKDIRTFLKEIFNITIFAIPNMISENHKLFSNIRCIVYQMNIVVIPK
jgi:hypothetical protein